MPAQRGPGSNGYEGVLHIPQSSSITGTSSSDSLVSYPGYSLGGGLTPSAEVQSVYSSAPADKANIVIVTNKIKMALYKGSNIQGSSNPVNKFNSPK